MKTKPMLVLLAFCLLPLAGQENLFRNGDLEKSGGWKGDGRVMAENGKTDNKVWAMPLGPKLKSFSQTISLNGKQKVLVVSFRVRASEDYAAGNPDLPLLEMRFSAPGEPSYSRQIMVTEKKVWRTYTYPIACEGYKSIAFSFWSPDGRGTLEFDDFAAIAK